MGHAMKQSFLAAAVFAALASPAVGQTAPPASTAKEDLVPVAIDTSVGRIVVALDRGHAPITTANFLHYADTHRYDGQYFYRAMHAPDANGADGGLIQGGITTDARKLYPPVAHESTAQTGLHNVTGAISLANRGAGTATSDFFIMVSDQPGLDANGPGGDATGFAAFGHVIEGMDVVRKIWTSPVSPTKGEGALKGQMLDPKIQIIKVARAK
jgi:peptidyl-prolyl cis-trans isomerase A (cyclophilin A)